MIEAIRGLVASSPELAAILRAAWVGVLAALAYVFAHQVLVRVTHAWARRTEATWDDILVRAGVFRRLAWIAPALVAYGFTGTFFDDTTLVDRIIRALIVAAFGLATSDLLAGALLVYGATPAGRLRPVKGYVQVVKLVVFLVSATFFVAALLDESPWAVVSGIGALTALLVLVFRDTILSFVTSVQIGQNDLVRIGDWVEVPRYGADGVVVDIALHTVRVQNWDNTFSVLPMHKLIEESFRNWRGMFDSGARRVKRAIYVDQSSVRFLDDAEIARLARIHLLTEYVERRASDIARWNAENAVDLSVLPNGRRMTNLGTFRAYLETFLEHHPRVRQDLPLLVRQLPPTAEGLPLELYCYVVDTTFVVYEKLQADLFDHALAVIPEFGLRVFQRPSGHDVRPAASEPRRP